ncbi:MAG: hypothetical protein AB7Q69_08080 [Gemmatimonadales bacterium]
MRIPPSIGLLGTGLLAGCVYTNAAVMNPTAQFAPICENGVTLYSTPDKVGKEYVEVAMLNSSGSSSWTTEEGMVHSMRRKAAELGATGIILNDLKDPSSGAKVAAAIFGVSAERKGRSIAIYVAADSGRVAEVCDGTRNRSDAGEPAAEEGDRRR